MIPWSGVACDAAFFNKLPRVHSQEGCVLITHYRCCTTYTDSQPLLKHSALTGATATSPATSHTQTYQRKGLSSLSLPCPVSRARKRGTVTTDHLDFRHQASSRACPLRHLSCCETFHHAWPQLSSFPHTGANTTSCRLHRVMSRKIRKCMQIES